MTIVSNSATTVGGALRSETTEPTLLVTNSIVSRNSAPTDDDISGALNSASANNYTGDDPMLSPLGFYRGPTKTMIPLLGSPVLDAAGAVTLATDQRGLARVVNGAADIGAVEAQGEAEDIFLDPDGDLDGDGLANLLEFATGRDPFMAERDSERMIRIARDGTVTFGWNHEAQSSVILRLTASDDLVNFNRTIFTSDGRSRDSSEMISILHDVLPDEDRPRSFLRLEAMQRR